MHGRQQGVLAYNAEFIKFNIVQEHIDSAEVIGGQIDLLTEETTLNIVLTQHFFHLQQQRARAAGGVIDLVDLSLADGAEPSQQFGHICRSKILTTLLTGIGCVHTHEIFVCVTKQIRVDAIGGKQGHLRHTIQQCDKYFISLCNSLTNSLCIHIETGQRSCSLHR